MKRVIGLAGAVLVLLAFIMPAKADFKKIFPLLEKSNLQLIGTPIITLCGIYASQWVSKKPADVSVTIRNHPGDDKTYEVMIYGRMLVGKKFKESKTVAEAFNNDLSTITSNEALRGYLSNHMDSRFFALMGPTGSTVKFLGACEGLTNKDAADKGELFRCRLGMPSTLAPATEWSTESWELIITSAMPNCDAGIKFADAKTLVGSADKDADGVPDELDNCEQVANNSQEDGDGNGTGDACAATATTCDPNTVCTQEVCGGLGFSATCDSAAICTQQVCVDLGYSAAAPAEGGGDMATASGGFCTLMPMASANPAGLVLLLSAAAMLVARRRG